MQPDIHITYADVYRFVFRSLPIALLAALVFGGLTYKLRSDDPPTFETTATLYAADKRLDLGSVNLSYVTGSALHVEAYRAAALGDTVLAAALRGLGVSEPSSQQIADLRGRLAVSTQADARLVDVRAQATSPQEAVESAEAVANALIAWDRERAADNLAKVLEIIDSRIAALDQEILSLRASTQDAAIQRQLDSRLALRAEQQHQLEQARMLVPSVIGLLELVRPASLPTEAIAPTPGFDAALAALLAFLATYAAMLARSVIDPRIRDVDELSEVAGLPVLAAYTRFAKGPRQLPRETTNFLRAGLLASTANREPRIIMVTSARGGEGKTSVAISLAESFARTGYRTLLVDADLRKPAIGATYGLAPSKQATFEGVLQSADGLQKPAVVRLEKNQALHVLPTFEANRRSTELIGQAFKDNVASWARDFEVVVIDTPPLFAVADALSIAPACSGVLMVVNPQSTKRKQLHNAIEVLASSGACILGLVATRLPRRKLRTREYGYSYATPPRTSYTEKESFAPVTMTSSN